MKLFELNSNYVDELKSTALNIVYTASANGSTTMSMHDMIADLNKEGYYVTAKDLIDILGEVPSIRDINAKEIQLDTGINPDEEDEVGVPNADKAEQDQAKVSDMATSQALKNIQQ
jgi:hypothetical protein